MEVRPVCRCSDHRARREASSNNIKDGWFRIGAVGHQGLQAFQLSGPFYDNRHLPMCIVTQGFGPNTASVPYYVEWHITTGHQDDFLFIFTLSSPTQSGYEHNGSYAQDQDRCTPSAEATEAFSSKRTSDRAAEAIETHRGRKGPPTKNPATEAT